MKAKNEISALMVKNRELTNSKYAVEKELNELTEDTIR